MIAAHQETDEQLIARLRSEGVLDEGLIRYVVLCKQPEGPQCILPGETREQAVARLMKHYGWDERHAEFAISVSQGYGDIVVVDENDEVDWEASRAVYAADRHPD